MRHSNRLWEENAPRIAEAPAPSACCWAFVGELALICHSWLRRTRKHHICVATASIQGVYGAAPRRCRDSRALLTTAPFNECPQIGYDASCGILIVISNNGEQVLQDPNNSTAGYRLIDQREPRYPGALRQVDDTLVGIVNESSKPVYGLQLSGESSGTDLFGFDGDGICTYALEAPILTND